MLMPFVLGDVATGGGNTLDFSMGSFNTINDSFQTSEGIIATNGDNTLYFNVVYSQAFNSPANFSSFQTISDGIIQNCKEGSSCLMKFNINDDLCNVAKTTVLSISDDSNNQVAYTTLTYDSDLGNGTCYFRTGFTAPTNGTFSLQLNYTDEGTNNFEYNTTFFVENWVSGSNSGGSSTPDVTTTTLKPNVTDVSQDFLETILFTANIPTFSSLSVLDNVNIVKKEVDFKYKHVLMLIIFIILLLIAIYMIRENKK